MKYLLHYKHDTLGGIIRSDNIELKSNTERKVLVLGRLPGVDIYIPDHTISRRHLELEFKHDGLTVCDLGSRNGTHIDGEVLPSLTPKIVRPGSLVKMGNITLVYQQEKPTALSTLDDVPQTVDYSRMYKAADRLQATANEIQPLSSEELLSLFQPGAIVIEGELRERTSLTAPLLVEAPKASLPPLENEQTSEKTGNTDEVKAVSPKPAGQPLIYRGSKIPPKPSATKIRTIIEVQRKDQNPGQNAAPEPIYFPNFMQMTSRLPQSVWQVLRFFSVILAISVATLQFVAPNLGLFLFWGLFIPLLPLLFFVAPGLWRNICPMAALNQLPRLLNITRGLTLPNWLKEYSYVIGIFLFMGIAATRKVLFNQNGTALGILMFASLGTALTMGTVFKGKSGWCSSLCPLLPVQRIYGQTPFLTVRNSHCQPCVGCTKNCYDFNPAIAYVADLNDDDPNYTAYRKFFAGAFPGFILAFYTTPSPPDIAIWDMYLNFALYICVSIGIFFALDSFLKVNTSKITAPFAALALNLYYWFNIPLFCGKIELVSGLNIPEWIEMLGFGLIVTITLVWLARTYSKEPLYFAKFLTSYSSKKSNNKSRINNTTASAEVEVNFVGDEKRVNVAQDTSLLEVIECNDLHIESGCRMGMCGADPVEIMEGVENLSDIGDDERTTLERLGLGTNIRLACCARVKGAVSVSLQPERQKMAESVKGISTIPFEYDTTIGRVVIIGNGIAGVTAADHIRRRHPDCEIHLIGREGHHLYNRMGIARLIYGRSAMQGLYLLPEDWYNVYKITCWLNTRATYLDRDKKMVVLGTGEALPYDKLVLAMGSSSHLPEFEGSELNGVFVLREAEDAMHIRAYVQEHGCMQAVVAGGGLLGLEAAYAMQKLGLEVTVLERSDSLLRRQLDTRSGQFLREYLESVGLNIVLKAELGAASGIRGVEQIYLKDGRRLPCDLLLVAAGIRPNIDLAKEAGLTTNRGVIVDDYLRTNDPDIYTVGDLAEYQGQISGLWPIAVEQGEIAAVNTIGGNQIYREVTAATALKVVGVELMSIGQFEPTSPTDIVITLEEPEKHRYRKLVISDGKLVGAILLGYQELASKVSSAVKKQQEVKDILELLRTGNWGDLG